jgi:hypothetical protein
MVYIFSEKQIFLSRVFSLDETNDEGKSGNGDRRIFESFIFVTTLNLWFSKINITELHLIQYCKGVI